MNDEPIEVNAEEVKPDAIVSTNPTPNDLLKLAVMQNLDVEKMEKLMDMQFRWEANEARKKYIEAMAEFQSRCPIIIKTKAGAETKAGDRAYKYAPLDVIVAQVKDLIKECGFSYMLKTDTIEGAVKVTCYIRHTAGHTEETDVTMPLVVKTGVMSPPQVIASTLTYAKRYAFCNGFGIMTGDEDNDAILPSQQEQLEIAIQFYPDKSHHRKMALSIESPNKREKFDSFLSQLPTPEQVAEFMQLIKELPDKDGMTSAQRQALCWEQFTKARFPQNKTVELFINKLKEGT